MISQVRSRSGETAAPYGKFTHWTGHQRQDGITLRSGAMVGGVHEQRR
jgi:hypothetical protein